MNGHGVGLAQGKGMAGKGGASEGGRPRGAGWWQAKALDVTQHVPCAALVVLSSILGVEQCHPSGCISLFLSFML